MKYFLFLIALPVMSFASEHELHLSYDARGEVVHTDIVPRPATIRVPSGSPDLDESVMSIDTKLFDQLMADSEELRVIKAQVVPQRLVSRIDYFSPEFVIGASSAVSATVAVIITSLYFKLNK